MDSPRLHSLLEQYASGSTSPAEEQELFARLDAATEGEEAGIRSLLQSLQEVSVAGEPFDRRRWEPVLERILSMTRPAAPTAPVRRLFSWSRLAAASIALLIICAGGWWLAHRTHPVAPTVLAWQTPGADIAPAGNHATLTLAGGQIIRLDSAGNGQLAIQGNTRILKTDSGRLSYSVSSPKELHKDQFIAYNTLATPRGGFYQLSLPDGSRVWLNAASSLRYPTAFTGAKREVEVNGEAYFEVAPDKARPFIVYSAWTHTTVLGTSFDICSYGDEDSLRVTLVTGAVKYTARDKDHLLRPGQQAVFNTTTDAFALRQADIAQTLAWKDGLFACDNQDLATILRQVSRWYDVDIHYQHPPGPEKFGGGISRKLPLSNILRLLENSGLHFRLEGRQLTVLQ